MNSYTDTQLLTDLRSSDKVIQDRALVWLYKELYPVILKMIQKNSGSEEEAADIFQDAIVVFYEKVRKNDFALSCTIKTYLYSVSKNIWYNNLKIKKRHINLDDDIAEVPIDQNSLHVILENERDQILLKMVSRLGENCRRILKLYYYDRLRMKEIAVKMKFANDNVAKNKKSKCLKKLKELVNQFPELKNYESN